MRRLHLIRCNDDCVDENARHKNLLRFHHSGLRQPLNLGDDDAAIVAHGEGLIQRAEIGTLMLVGEVRPWWRE